MNYQRGQLIGSGGTSMVYDGVALQGALVSEGTPVALKYLRDVHLDDQELIKRFLQEIKTSYDVTSENITQGYDVEMDGNSPVLVMERLYGETLRLRLKQGKPLTESEALKVANGVANALAAIHQQRIVHRDIKPGNIHLGQRWKDEPSAIKLMDFGIAKLQGSQLTQHNSQLGTPQYMSPEQIQNPLQVDHRCDLYSLGIILWEMMVGHPPFQGNDIQVMKQQMESPPPELPEEISVATRALVSHLLEKNPDRRPDSALRVKRQIELICSPESVPATVARPTSVGQGHHSPIPISSKPDGFSAQWNTEKKPGTQKSQPAKKAPQGNSNSSLLWIMTVVVAIVLLGGCLFVLFNR